MPSEPTDLLLHDVSFSYSDGFALPRINLQVPARQMACMLGPNGSGKTTLLKLASGVLHPTRGDVRVGGVSLDTLTRKQVAQRMAVVPQQFNIPFAYTVEEVALLGRTPFVHGLGGETRRDRQIATSALELTCMAGFSSRFFNDLSGGERQKTVLAMALAQEPRLLLLDEPTAHLDINHQVEILELLRNLNRDKQITVVAVMHDLNLAALYFERLVLLNHGCIVADGSPSQVITEDILHKVFSTAVAVGRHPKTSVPQIVIMPPGSQSDRETH
jgi:iron complex transport system ATP-binding protein